MEWDIMECIHLAQNEARYQVVVNNVMNSWVLYKEWNLLSN
jgi:hypothetical protein